MSPEQTPESGKVMRPVGTMNYQEIARIAINFDTPKNLNVLGHELLRRSANSGVQEDPLYQKTWELVQGLLDKIPQDSQSARS